MKRRLETAWKISNTNNCWNNCDYKGGSCSWCGLDGYCCSGNPGYAHVNGNCGNAQLVPVVEHWQTSGNGYHMCVSPTFGEIVHTDYGKNEELSWSIGTDSDTGIVTGCGFIHITYDILFINSNEYSGQVTVSELQPSPVSISLSSNGDISNDGFILKWKCVQCCDQMYIKGANFDSFNQLYRTNGTYLYNRPFYQGVNNLYGFWFSGTHWIVGNVTDIVESDNQKANLFTYIESNHAKPCPGRDDLWKEIMETHLIDNNELHIDCHCKYTTGNYYW